MFWARTSGIAIADYITFPENTRSFRRSRPEYAANMPFDWRAANEVLLQRTIFMLFFRTIIRVRSRLTGADIREQRY